MITSANHVHHPGLIGHQVSAPLSATVLADMRSALLSNGMAIYEMGQLHTAMERRVIQWLGAQVGFTDRSDGVLTHGGSLGNLTALLAARQAKAHDCVARAVQCMGWWAKGVATVPTDDRFRLRPRSA